MNDGSQGIPPEIGKIGLTMSGGGARGFAHIGVYRAMREFGLDPQIISGTSMGAIVGALIANGYSPEEITDLAKTESKARLFHFSGLRMGISGHRNIGDILSGLLPDRFEALAIPFHVAATNLDTASLEVFSSGPLVEAILASISIPVVFTPMKIANRLYVDGGLVKNLPASVIRGQCDFLIGSHVNHIPKSFDPSGTGSIIDRCIRIAIANTIFPDKALCDVFIDPQDSGTLDVLDFKQVDQAAEIGYRTAHRILTAKGFKVKT